MCKRCSLWLCVFAVGLIAISPGFSAMTDGLVGLWLFDEGSGQTASDSSGNGYHGALMGNASWESNGKSGSALSTDGTEGYVEIPDDPAFEFDGNFTIACWVQNQDPLPDHSSFVTKGYDKGLAFEGVGYGDSYLLDPLGEIVVRSQRHVECMITARIDVGSPLKDKPFFSKAASHSRESAKALGPLLMQVLDEIESRK